jgi:hypothetical protein
MPLAPQWAPLHASRHGHAPACNQVWGSGVACACGFVGEERPKLARRCQLGRATVCALGPTQALTTTTTTWTESFVFKAWDYDTVGSDDFLGSCVVGGSVAATIFPVDMTCTLSSGAQYSITYQVTYKPSTWAVACVHVCMCACVHVCMCVVVFVVVVGSEIRLCACVRVCVCAVCACVRVSPSTCGCVGVHHGLHAGAPTSFNFAVVTREDNFNTVIDFTPGIGYALPHPAASPPRHVLTMQCVCVCPSRVQVP